MKLKKNLLTKTGIGLLTVANLALGSGCSGEYDDRKYDASIVQKLHTPIHTTERMIFNGDMYSKLVHELQDKCPEFKEIPSDILQNYLIELNNGKKDLMKGDTIKLPIYDCYDWERKNPREEFEKAFNKKYSEGINSLFK